MMCLVYASLQGYVPRQALYACDTCTGPAEMPAGICLACSYECHEGHQLHELYTKRYVTLHKEVCNFQPQMFHDVLNALIVFHKNNINKT